MSFLKVIVLVLFTSYAYSSVLEEVHEIMIEERDNFYYKRITSLELTGDYLLISDWNSKVSIIYERATGKIIKNLTIDINCLDYLIDSSASRPKDYKYTYYERINSKNQNLPFFYAKPFSIVPENIININDTSYLVFVKIKTIYYKEINQDTSKTIVNNSGYGVMDKHFGITKVIPFKHDSLSTYSNAFFSAVHLNDKIITPCQTPYMRRQREEADFFPCICEYDLEGNLTDYLMELPDIQIKSGIDYIDLGRPQLLINNNEELLAAFPVLETIFNLNTNDTIRLVNMRADNYYYIDKMINNELTRSQLNQEKEKYLPNIIDEIFQDKEGNYYVSLYSNLPNEVGEADLKRQIQKYDDNWNFIDEVFLEIEDANEREILKIDYSKEDDLFVIALKGKKRNFVSFRRWKD